MEALEEMGLKATGQYLQLNSYENRVFEVELEADTPSTRKLYSQLGGQNRLIVKLYRPGRWSRSAILEEHLFLDELCKSGLRAIAPIEFPILPDRTLHCHNAIYLCAFPKGMGRMPQELFKEDYIKIGKSLALLHNIGQQHGVKYRPSLNTELFGYSNLDLLETWVSPEVYKRYFSAAEDILAYLDDHLDESSFIRIHGDCHRGNLLLSDPRHGEKQFFFVDFDDFISGPVAQDFWMLFSSLEQQEQELEWLLAGYDELRRFPTEQIQLFQALRGLRIIHYAAWIARRWKDPSFPKLFPNFLDYSYWAEEAEALEKIAWNL